MYYIKYTSETFGAEVGGSDKEEQKTVVVAGE